VVAGGQETGGPERDAAFLQAAVFVGIRRASRGDVLAGDGGALGPGLFRRGGKGRKPSVRRIDHERRLVVRFPAFIPIQRRTDGDAVCAATHVAVAWTTVHAGDPAAGGV